jgi:hypothetical protein
VRRPLPLIPTGPRRLRRRAESRRLFFACPRVSPEWELGVLHALMKPKPQTRGAVEHRSGEQTWNAAADAIFDEVLAVLTGRLGLALAVHRAAAGEYHFLAEFGEEQTPEVRALALVLSRRLPGLWFVVGRVLVRGGVFYRRQFGYKLNLVPASDVHLTRAIRSALKGLL